MLVKELFVVPGERHVERLARRQLHAETRTSLRSRLAAALLPDATFIDSQECRLVLGASLAMAVAPSVSATAAASGPSPYAGGAASGDPPTTEGPQQRPARQGGRKAAASQLTLFGTSEAKSPASTPSEPAGVAASARDADAAAAAASAYAAALEDELLCAVRSRGGGSWARLIAALDDAISLLRMRNATADHLERVARASGFLARRARTLATAMRALDASLAVANAHDGRLVGVMLADAIRKAPPETVERLVGAHQLRSRWLLAWEPSDAAWWRALDDKLGPRGGGARVVLPLFDRPLAGTRERDPLDTLAEEVAQTLDSPTEGETIAPVLGDLSGSSAGDGASAVDAARVQIISASDASAQARAVAREVVQALAAGAAVERIVVALPSMDERTLIPLRRALDAEGVIWHESRGGPPSDAPVIAAALLALDAATSLDRFVVARLLRSGWVDAARVSGQDRHAAERILSRLARTFETSATAAGGDPLERLVRTASLRSRASRRLDIIPRIVVDLGGVGRRDEPPLSEPTMPEDEDVAVCRRLTGTFSSLRSARTRLDHIRAVRRLWNDLGLGPRAGRGGLATFGSDGVPTGVARAERLAIARDARAWDALVGALDTQERVAARVGALDQPIDAASFRLELLALLDAAASRPGAGFAAAVRLTRLADVAGDEVDLLVVADASDGVLPRDDIHDALVSDTLAEAIGRASGGTFVPAPAGTRRARDLATLAVAAADARRIVFVHPREDGAGAPLAPSSVIGALVRSGLSISVAEIEPPRVSGVDVALRASRERQREGFFLDPARPLSDVVGDLVPTDVAAQLLLVETGGDERPLAVTGLERLARCPFMGYAHVILAAREAEQTEELPDAREEGTLVHEALAAAFLATRELWPRRPRPSEVILSSGMAAADALLDRWQGYASLRAVVRLGVGDAVRSALLQAIDDPEWDFFAAEQAFGANGTGSWQPLTIVEEGGLRVALRGSIDRVDRTHDGTAVRVMDYKRSKSTVVAAGSALGETALQVPLYACVAQRELALPATGVYVATQARDVDQRPSARVVLRMAELVTRPSSPGSLAPIEARAVAIVASVRRGALAPVPATEAECRFCAVSGGCRKPRFAMAPDEDADDDRDRAPTGREVP